MKAPPAGTCTTIGVGTGVCVAVLVGVGVEVLVAVFVAVAVAVLVGVGVAVRVAHAPAISVALATTVTKPLAQLRSNSPPGGTGVTWPRASATEHPVSKRRSTIRRPRRRIIGVTRD